MRDFEWTQDLWCVVKNNGSFAGVPCVSWEEARELANQHDGSHIFKMMSDNWGELEYGG